MVSKRLVFLCLALWGQMSRASAQVAEAPEGVAVRDAITVRSTESCLDAQTIAQHVVRWLHRETIDARLGVVLRPAPNDAGVLLEIVREGEVVAERTFDAGHASCAERQAALGLMIALALDATVVETITAPPMVTPSSPPDEPVVLVPPVRARVLAFGLDGTAWLGVLPRASGGASLWAELAWSDVLTLRITVLGNGTTPATLERGRVSTAFIAGRGDACVGVSSARLRFEGCAGLVAGGVIAKGHGFSTDARALVPWAAVALGAGGRVSITERVGLRLAVEAAVPFVRPELAITDVEGSTVARLTPSRAAVGIAIGAVYAFR